MLFTVRYLIYFLMIVFITDTAFAKAASSSSSNSSNSSNSQSEDASEESDSDSTFSISTKTSASVSSSATKTVSPSTTNSTAASTSTMKTPLAKNKQTPQAPPFVSGWISFSRSTSLNDYQDGTRKDGLDTELHLTFQVAEKYSLNFIGGYSQDLKNSDNDDAADTAVILARSPEKFGKTFLVGYNVSSVLPSSKDSYKNKGLQGSLGAGLSVLINPDRLIKGLMILGSASFGRNFHEYETAVDGKVNNQYSSKQMLYIKHSFTPTIMATGTFIHRNSWSYQNVMRDSFESSEEIGYLFTENFYVGVGHTNSGNTLKPNGTESNVQLINENTSLVFVDTAIYF
ncbi:MAG: hypothetical protein ACXVCN_12665 [Bdellovibrio sp.]